MITPRCCLASLLVFAGVASAQPLTVESIQDTGPARSRVDIAVLGDGFRDVDQALLSTATREFFDRLWGTPPYDRYRGLFNVKLVHVVSQQNGATDGTYGGVRQNALGARYFCGNVERALCVDNTIALQVADQYVPEHDVVLVLVNDPKYGGTGGAVAVASLDPYAALVVIHELGHTFADLADEYVEVGSSYPPCRATSDCSEANATIRTSRVKWAPWVDAGTPIPTPDTSTYAQTIGMFEGCRYLERGVYRPTRDRCLMRSLGPVEAFCEVCREAISVRLWRYGGMIDSLSPAGHDVPDAGGTVSFSVTLAPVPAPTLETRWELDGELVSDGGTSFQLDVDSLDAGFHVLRLVAHDPSPYVRNDPAGRLYEGWYWALCRGDCPDAGEPDAGEQDAGARDAGTPFVVEPFAGFEPRPCGGCSGTSTAPLLLLAALTLISARSASRRRARARADLRHARGSEAADGR